MAPTAEQEKDRKAKEKEAAEEAEREPTGAELHELLQAWKDNKRTAEAYFIKKAEEEAYEELMQSIIDSADGEIEKIEKELEKTEQAVSKANRDKLDKREKAVSKAN